MNVESRDSVSLKPAELDEFGQLLLAAGLPVSDAELDHQVEQFPLVVLATTTTSSRASCSARSSGSAARRRSSGAPASPGGTRKRRTTLRLMTSELSRRAAISFPDEDVRRRGPGAPPERLHAAADVRERRAPARATRRTARTGRGVAGSRSASVSRPLRRPDVPRRGQGPQAAVRPGARRQRRSRRRVERRSSRSSASSTRARARR